MNNIETNQVAFYTDDGKFEIAKARLLELILEDDPTIDISEFKYVPDSRGELVFENVPFPVKDFVHLTCEYSYNISRKDDPLSISIEQELNKLLDLGYIPWRPYDFTKKHFLIRDFDDELYYFCEITSVHEQPRISVLKTPLKKLNIRAKSYDTYAFVHPATFLPVKNTLFGEFIRDKGFVILTYEDRLFSYAVKDRTISDSIEEDLKTDILIDKFYVDNKERCLYAISGGTLYAFDSKFSSERSSEVYFSYPEGHLFQKVYRFPRHVGIETIVIINPGYFYVTNSGVMFQMRENLGHRESLIYEFGDFGIGVPIVDMKELFYIYNATLRSKPLHTADIFAVRDAHGNVHLVVIDTRSYDYLVYKLVGEELYLTKQFNRIVRTKSARY